MATSWASTGSAAARALPYEESIVQPLVMRVPSRYLTEDRAVPSVPEMAANIDLAPTMLEFAGAEPCTADGDCRLLDGRSLVPLLEGETAGFARRGVLVEYRAPHGAGRRTAEGGACEYGAIRTELALYTRYTRIANDAGACVVDLEVEHYDLQDDPFELDNLFPGATPAIEQEEDELRARLTVLELQRNGPAGRTGKPRLRVSRNPSQSGKLEHRRSCFSREGGRRPRCHAIGSLPARTTRGSDVARALRPAVRCQNERLVADW
jgi:arylsulfatase A-like enzyme